MSLTLRISIVAGGLGLAAIAGTSGRSLAQAYVPPPPGYGAADVTGSITADPAAPPASRYETDGNSKTPRAMNAPDAPAYQQGSGQQTGGPARELIPR